VIEHDNDAKNRAMISEDELKDVSGGDGEAMNPFDDFLSRDYVFDFSKSGSTPKYSVGEQVGHHGYRVTVTNVSEEAEGWFCKEYEYTVRVDEGEYINRTGTVYEHQLYKL
jgi:hypothetical protein